VHAALYSADGDAEAPMDIIGADTLTNGCESSDWNGFRAGDVALVFTGGCYTLQKIELAQNAGAAAVISCYPTWQENEIRRPTLIDPAAITIPVVAAGSEPCNALESQEGNVVNVFVDGENRTATVDNVIATLPGATERVVMLGGHLDSVLDGPGINDNGSGVATIMSLAASIAAQPQAQTTIRIGFWSAEEWGDLGSQAYVDSLDPTQIGLIDAYLNLDMVGSPNPGRYVYDEAGPAGTTDLTASLLAAFETLGAPATTTDTGGASDHFWFGQAGVPIGGVFSGLLAMTSQEAALFGGNANELEDPCYHLACDTTQNIDLDSAALLGQAIAIVLGDVAY
jgi:Zn-dependent M28 family amino/carboxypeptidase